MCSINIEITFLFVVCSNRIECFASPLPQLLSFHTNDCQNTTGCLSELNTLTCSEQLNTDHVSAVRYKILCCEKGVWM